MGAWVAAEEDYLVCANLPCARLEHSGSMLRFSVPMSLLPPHHVPWHSRDLASLLEQAVSHAGRTERWRHQGSTVVPSAHVYLLVNFPTSRRMGSPGVCPENQCPTHVGCLSFLSCYKDSVCPYHNTVLVALGILLGKRILESVRSGLTHVGPASQAKSQGRCLSPSLHHRPLPGGSEHPQ